MKEWNTDKIIGAGLIISLLAITITDTIISILSGTIPSRELAGNIVSGLIGYMGRSLIDKKKDEPPSGGF